MKKLLLIFTAFFIVNLASAQISAKLMRYMDVSGSQITFVYGGDVWLVDKTGGTAYQVTSSPGEESWPRFSPDGKHIAYTASYNGNADVFLIPVSGGVPKRITHNAFPDRMVDWHPDGEKLLFASNRENGISRLNQFFMVDKNGGFPEKLPIPYGELASFSPDGKKMAYITKITENYPFKRYRGGLTSDIIVYDFESKTTERITENKSNDGQPTWAGNNIYFLSDRGENMRLNVWEYNTGTDEIKQVTFYKDFDISFMTAGPDDIVFEMGGDLYLMDLQTLKPRKVEVNVISDLSTEMPQTKNVSRNISNATASPGGKRVVFEARGELFNVPVEEGFTLNMTQSSGAFDQSPAWSPDGKTIAYWSDKSGEYELYLQDSEVKEEARQLTKRGKGFGYKLFWSPNSKKIAFIDETNTIQIIDAESKKITEAGNTRWNVGHGARFNFPISWSHDSKWIAFTERLNNANSAIFVFNTEENKKHQLTTGFYEDNLPVFSTDGKYLFYLTNRNMDAAYSDLDDGTWIYPNATQIAALSLTPENKSVLAPKNDEVEIKEDKEEKEENGKENKENGNTENGDGENEENEEDKKAEINFENAEARVEILPPKAGNISNLIPFDGKLVYLRRPNTGSGERSSSLHFFDLKEREEKEIMGNVSQVAATADGKSLIILSQGKYCIIQPAPGQKIENPIPTDGLEMELIPKEEWRQIFMDTWRRHRDFFYDPNMQGVDWKEMHDRYSKLLDDVRTRWDVTNLQLNLVAELSAGHTYAMGGDAESSPSRSNGFLGIDWELNNGKYRIKRIVQPAEWDTEVRSPFDKPGVEVNEGDYILSVNKVDLNPEKDPYAAFEGLSGKTVSLEVSPTGQKDDAKNVVVKCLSRGEEINLRYLEWIENNRKMVDELSDGQLGYIYMSNTSARGQLELVRMFYGQLDKKGFILDERWNGGGQLADRFLELLQRPVTYNLHWRHGKDHTNPIKTNTGPVGMLINGWAGSGGDGLPWAFQELEAGPIVGERTLGILVGPATGHRLIDGGAITVPGARLYDNDGHWFWEGEGVAPDFKVWDDPDMLMQGRDPQMEKVVEEVLELTKENKHLMTPAPPLEDRTAKGLRDSN
ncbi:tricorn protease [Tangfeifania diversioriginum]|uniref:Tricorn protease homolog n=1 Tax=Tangfeifania diversioriginum TaxID=1168035 RepID=A0A1M6FXK8_9BACT|nr:S41 family peptidase [Tangfeifania diversioriginum]SHJ02416.1 tricorn protease [Tangfeifania diversioriginum]